MALSYKTRKRLSLLILLVWMPAFVVIAVTVMTALPDRLPFALELLAYVSLGLVCFLPYRRVFLGVGKPDPDAPDEG